MTEGTRSCVVSLFDLHYGDAAILDVEPTAPKERTKSMEPARDNFLKQPGGYR